MNKGRLIRIAIAGVFADRGRAGLPAADLRPHGNGIGRFGPGARPASGDRRARHRSAAGAGHRAARRRHRRRNRRPRCRTSAPCDGWRGRSRQSVGASTTSRRRGRRSRRPARRWKPAPRPSPHTSGWKPRTELAGAEAALTAAPGRSRPRPTGGRAPRAPRRQRTCQHRRPRGGPADGACRRGSRGRPGGRKGCGPRPPRGGRATASRAIRARTTSPIRASGSTRSICGSPISPPRRAIWRHDGARRARNFEAERSWLARSSGERLTAPTRSVVWRLPVASGSRRSRSASRWPGCSTARTCFSRCTSTSATRWRRGRGEVDRSADGRRPDRDGARRPPCAAAQRRSRNGSLAADGRRAAHRRTVEVVVQLDAAALAAEETAFLPRGPFGHGAVRGTDRPRAPGRSQALFDGSGRRGARRRRYPTAKSVSVRPAGQPVIALDPLWYRPPTALALALGAGACRRSGARSTAWVAPGVCRDRRGCQHFGKPSGGRLVDGCCRTGGRFAGPLAVGRVRPWRRRSAGDADLPC